MQIAATALELSRLGSHAIDVNEVHGTARTSRLRLSLRQWLDDCILRTCARGWRPPCIGKAFVAFPLLAAAATWASRVEWRPLDAYLGS